MLAATWARRHLQRLNNYPADQQDKQALAAYPRLHSSPTASLLRLCPNATRSRCSWAFWQAPSAAATWRSVLAASASPSPPPASCHACILAETPDRTLCWIPEQMDVTKSCQNHRAQQPPVSAQQQEAVQLGACWHIGALFIDSDSLTPIAIPFVIPAFICSAQALNDPS